MKRFVAGFRHLVLLLSALLTTSCALVPAVEEPTGVAITDATAPAAVTGATEQAVHTVLVPASAAATSATASLDCPGPGLADCEINWRTLQAGWSEQQVIAILGESTDHSEPQIFIDRVTWQWGYDGGLVEFSDGVVSEIVFPLQYGFPAGSDVAAGAATAVN